MNKFYALVVMVAALLLSGSAQAQETLVAPAGNPAARPQPRPRWDEVKPRSPYSGRGLTSPGQGMPELPFVDDFAGRHAWPDVTLWTSDGVYVNSHYALNMPTIGVATFDALDARGRLYEHLNDAPAPADTLTSLPIKMDSKPGVVLSFFYQPGGLGDMPGLLDKLRLEFNAPDTNWTEVWSAAVNIDSNSIVEYRSMNVTGGVDTITRRFDTLNTQFVYVALAIDDPIWHKDGFQFRFTNDVSLTVNRDVPGRASNADFWHLDFVYLDSGRDTTNTRLPDVGIAQPQAPVTAMYASIPARHLGTTASIALFPGLTTFNIAYRNLGMGTQNVRRRFSIIPLNGSTTAPKKDYPGGAENIFDGQLQERAFEFEPYDFVGAVSGSTATAVTFEISSCLVYDMGTGTLRSALQHNDTTRYIQEFQDYYAYDDGSAENGYGLFGYGTSNGRVAVRFTSLCETTDSLSGVYLYFNMAKDSANLKTFELAVWDDNGGVPGRILRREKFDRPEVRDSANDYNVYVPYKFNTPVAIARNQVFYVGWIQSSEVFLNIGFDANTPAAGRNLYALGGGNWYESMYDGTLMIRPIFTRTSGNFPGNPVEPVAPDAAAKVPDEYIVYPNPATDRIHVRNLKAEMWGTVPPRPLIEIYDVSGRKHRTGYVEGDMFRVSGLPAGMYIVRIIENGAVKTSQKIIVN
ncbi:MAG: T9SS type A sorting domain-containing protein [Prevotellaceae bacterium]|jgi:hypothetical protein|nr:T9SS type A sorting domain-containing protein [Prevotellaceae bacterium]